MPLASFETPLESTATRAFHDGPILDCAPSTTSPRLDTTDPTLCIRAHRVYPASREELFASWTRRTAWDSWMRLRSRSRSTLSPCRGGAFRLELAEGPAIHVITGVVHDIRPDELLSLGWVHQNTNDHGSTVDVTFQSAHDGTALTLVHRGITSRREASWLMRLWSAVLGRLETYVAGGVASSTRCDTRHVRVQARPPLIGRVAYVHTVRRASSDA